MKMGLRGGFINLTRNGMEPLLVGIAEPSAQSFSFPLDENGKTLFHTILCESPANILPAVISLSLFQILIHS